jgi:hypothetical protein
MTPDELEKCTEKAIEDCQIGNLSEKFKDQLRDFIQTHLIREIKRVRTSIGLQSENISK